MKVAYGGVVFDEQNRVLLRKVSGSYGGYVWTFAKGRPEPGECPEEAAIREVLEETGVKTRIIGALPTPYKGDETATSYFLMAPVGTVHPFDKETEEIRWVSVDEAVELIALTTSANGKKRDLKVLSDAMKAYWETPEVVLNAANPLYRPHARAIHLMLTALQPGCVPRLGGENSTSFIYYDPYPNLFRLRVNSHSCSLHISKLLNLEGEQIIPGRQKWDVLKIENDGAIKTLQDALNANRHEVEDKLYEIPRHGTIPSGKGSLPVLELDVDELCFISIIWDGAFSMLRGRTYAYSFEALQTAATSAKMSLDEFLTRRIVSSLNSSKSKRKLLFWYWTDPGTIYITVTEAREKTGAAWMKDLDGFRGYGPDHMHRLATPFMYWDKRSAFRVYAPPAGTEAVGGILSEGAQSNYYVSDLGIVPGNVTSTRVKRSDYNRIRKDKLEYWAYTAIPESERECFTAGGKLLRVSHAFYKLSGEFGELVNSYLE